MPDAKRKGVPLHRSNDFDRGVSAGLAPGCGEIGAVAIESSVVAEKTVVSSPRSIELLRSPCATVRVHIACRLRSKVKLVPPTHNNNNNSCHFDSAVSHRQGWAHRALQGQQ